MITEGAGQTGPTHSADTLPSGRQAVKLNRPIPALYLFSVAQPSRLRVKWASSPNSQVWRRDVARTRRRGRLRYACLRSSLNTYSGGAGGGGLKARDITAWAGASSASGGPGNRMQKKFRGLKGRNKTSATIQADLHSFQGGQDFFRTLSWGFTPGCHITGFQPG